MAEISPELAEELAKAYNPFAFTSVTPEGWDADKWKDFQPKMQKSAHEVIADLAPILSRALAEAAEAGKALGWIEGKAAMTHYLSGARRKVPYPTNPYLTEKEQSNARTNS